MGFGVKLLVRGEHALFTRPEMKVERVSYDVMTPSAARGLIEAIYWKPAIRWVIDRIHVLHPIRFADIRRNEVGKKIPEGNMRSALKKGTLEGLHLFTGDDRQQRASLVLVDPAYLIEAHFVMTDKAGPGDNPAKHQEMFTRRAAKGQCFHQPCLGTREFAADFTLIQDGMELPKPIQEDRDLGYMLWDIDHEQPGRPAAFFRARLAGGILEVPAPGSKEVLA